MMLRYHTRALRLILQPHSFYSFDVTLFERKSRPNIFMYATEARNEWILNKISKLRNDEFKNVTSNEWLNRIDLMVYYFTKSQCFNIIKRHPGILQIHPEELEKTLKQWFCSRLQVVNCKKIIFTNPVLLEIEDHVIRKRLPNLMGLCTEEMVTDLLLKSPCVMFYDWEVVLKKINYLLHVRGFKMKQVIDSCALSLPFDFIKFRFDILEKCGIYKQGTLHSHKTNKYDQSQHKNPSLNNILATSDKYFSHAIANISVEEYNVCYELFMEEQSEADDDDNDDDDDDDNDDNDDDDGDGDGDDYYHYNEGDNDDNVDNHENSGKN